MTNNKNNSSPELNDPQGIDRSLLEYLKPKSEDRYSKLEAYCDLLTRATSVSYSTSVAVGNLKLLPGQFVATISELARKWQWQRATVRQFLTGLANLGHLTMEQYSKSYVFSVSQEQRLSLFTSTTSLSCFMASSEIFPFLTTIPSRASLCWCPVADISMDTVSRA